MAIAKGFSNSGIKNLRTRDFQHKPILVAMASAVSEALAFLGRMILCESLAMQVCPNSDSASQTRFVLGENGKWTRAKNQ